MVGRGEEVDGEEGGVPPRPVGEAGVVAAVPGVDHTVERPARLQAHPHKPLQWPQLTATVRIGCTVRSKKDELST